MVGSFAMMRSSSTILATQIESNSGTMDHKVDIMRVIQSPLVMKIAAVVIGLLVGMDQKWHEIIKWSFTLDILPIATDSNI